jgi:hypothetical protein
VPTLRSRLRAALALPPLALAAACASEEGTGPTRESVAGQYVATSFTTTEDGDDTDQLAQGATLSLTLNANGTAAGQLFIPAESTGEDELDASMAGTWTLEGSTVRLTQTADTFVRDTDWQVSGNALVADETFGSLRMRITLTRQP